MKAVIYARYSSDNQREESIEAQVRAIREFASRNGYEIINTYFDEARSATTDDRPKFLDMVRDSQKGQFQAVIVHKLDRFARNRYDSAFYKRELKKNGVRLVSVLENLDDSPESIILESVLEGMAEYYSKNLAREVMKGMKETALKCQHTGGTPPLGYDVDPTTKKYIINEEEAKTIRLIFSMFYDGIGYNQIVAKLNMLGLKSKVGKAFGKNSINALLKNQKYIGVYTYNRVVHKVNGKRNSRVTKDEDEIIRIENGLPAIIEKNVFEEIQERLSNRKLNGANKAKEVYLLSGLIRCGKCGASMIGHTSNSGRNKDKYSTYRCGKRYQTKECDAKAVEKNYIENFVIQDIKKEILNLDKLDDLVKKFLRHYSMMQKEKTSDLEVFEKRLKEIQKDADSIADIMIKGGYNAIFMEKLNKLEEEKASILKYISEIENSMQNTGLNSDMIKEYLLNDIKIINDENTNANKLKKLVGTYVDSVTIYGDKADTALKLQIVHLTDGGEPYRIVCTNSFIFYRHNQEV